MTVSIFYVLIGHFYAVYVRFKYKKYKFINIV